MDRGRNRSAIDNDGQRANRGDRRLISGCRRSSSLQVAAGRPAFRLPYVVQPSGCRRLSRLICRASCKDDDTIPWRNSQWVTGYVIMPDAPPPRPRPCRQRPARRQSHHGASPDGIPSPRPPTSHVPVMPTTHRHRPPAFLFSWFPGVYYRHVTNRGAPNAECPGPEMSI